MDIILHHYDASPFSEKVRLALGIKDLAWASVVTPNMLPKADLTPLTGGYRRAPVMQIGADIFCDSQAILAELDRRAPSPGFAGHAAWAVNLWADRLFFMAAVPAIFGEIGEFVPKAFLDDRAKMSGRLFDVAAMKAAAPAMRAQCRAHAAWIEGSLSDGDFLGGAAPGLADVAAYMNIWFLKGAVAHLYGGIAAGMPRLEAWRERLAGIGHGERREILGAEALAIARDSEPADPPAHDPADPSGLAPGARVTVAADDYGRDPVAGTLVAARPGRIVIARQDERLGRTHVHFPRVGYDLAGS